MTSIFGANRRKQAAQQRMNEILPSIAQKLDIDLRERPRWRNNSIREDVEREEWLLECFESINGALDGAQVTPQTETAG